MNENVPVATIIGNALYLVQHFERVENGWIGYKIFNSLNIAPDAWIFEPHSILTDEYLDTNPNALCRAGINLANSIDWVHWYVAAECQSVDQYGDEQGDIWKVFVPDSAVIIVPYNTSGKIRTNCIELLEVVAQVDYTTKDGKPLAADGSNAFTDHAWD